MPTLARSPRTTRLLAAAIAIAMLCTAFVLIFPRYQAEAQTPEPPPFPHVRMVSAGVPCLFCHSGAIRSPVAGIPSVTRCIDCHKTIATSSPLIGKVFAFRGQDIPWPRVNRMPRFVHFTHEVHIAQGINCERCHGDVGKMTVTTQVYRLNMGFCLDCHEKQPNGQQLKDCGVCHY